MTTNSPGPAAPAILLIDPAAPTPMLFRPLGAQFDPIHFTKYSLNLDFSKFTLENILLADHLERSHKPETFG
ncbi:hypothetical protein DSO57_1005147 [Entomophthora muscae]|uniref:Uncharacterized protein n=1 Tax=Entomophthora muscae TaxID=34485 RepID=A0ACC2RZ10_9FUNG|nr:hypothetical protein DSO57_1005147 [Entomophthora muscae]